MVISTVKKGYIQKTICSHLVIKNGVSVFEITLKITFVGFSLVYYT